MKRLLITLVLGALIAHLTPVVAQSSGEWQSTSTLPASGSAYSSQVTPVGATTVQSQATTAGSSPLRVGRGPRKDDDFNNTSDAGDTTEEGSPVGSPLVLLSFALAAAAVIRYRQANPTRS